MRTGFDALNNWLVSLEATYAICGAILAVVLIWFIYSRLRLRKARLSVDDAAREVENLGSERAFTKEFETLNRKFAEHPFLRHSWREFADTLILLSLRAAGVGLTIFEANHVIHLSRWWNPAVEDQATDRVYRIGLTRAVHVYTPLAIHPRLQDASFDVRLHELITNKRRLSQSVLAPAGASDGELTSLYQAALGAT